MPVYKKTSPAGKVSWYAIFYYKDWNGTRKQKKKEGFATQREAKAYERDFLERRAATPSMTFAALVDLEDYKSRNRATTYHTTENIMGKHILPRFKDIPVNEITPAMVRAWQNELIASGEYADSFLHRVHVTLSAVLAFAVKYYHLPQNAARLAGSMGKQKSRPIAFWTLAQFRQFQEAIEGNEPYSTLFTLLFYTGLRIGEALALTPGDIDLEGGTLSVTKTYKKLNKQDVIQPPKTEKGRRVVTLPPFLVDILRQYTSSLYGIKKNQRLFECVGLSAVGNNLRRYAAAAGLPRIRVHDLRHAHASLLIEQGFSPIAIRDRLGHEDIQTTLNTYGHLYPNKQEEISARLEELAAGSAAVEE